MIEKNTQPRHPDLKTTAFSIAIGKSRSTRISLLTVFVTVRDSYSLVWVTLEVSFNLSNITDSVFLSSSNELLLSKFFMCGPKWVSWWKSKDSSSRNVKNIMEFFHTGSLTMSNLLYLELYLPQNDSILLPFNPMKSWLTLTDLGSRVFLRNQSGEKAS